jgi:hypothetical protein
MTREVSSVHPHPLSRAGHPNDLARSGSRAVNRIAALGEELGTLTGEPEGEVPWCEGGDSVTLSPDRWFVWVNRGKMGMYGRRLPATRELLTMLRGRG